MDISTISESNVRLNSASIKGGKSRLTPWRTATVSNQCFICDQFYPVHGHSAPDSAVLHSKFRKTGAVQSGVNTASDRNIYLLMIIIFDNQQKSPYSDGRVFFSCRFHPRSSIPNIYLPFATFHVAAGTGSHVFQMSGRTLLQHLRLIIWKPQWDQAAFPW